MREASSKTYATKQAVPVRAGGVLFVWERCSQERVTKNNGLTPHYFAPALFTVVPVVDSQKKPISTGSELLLSVDHWVVGWFG